MDIFQPHKNAKTVVQKGLPKVLNQHIAEYWGFRKCNFCSKHKHLNHFKEGGLHGGYVNGCFDCRYIYLLWPDIVNKQTGRIQSAGQTLKDVYRMPKWMTFNDANYIYSCHDLKMALIDILQFADEYGIPPEYLDYKGLWNLYS